jgi:hypothetical protein
MSADEDEFDPDRPPVIQYRVIDSDRPELVCDWRWWGPTRAWDVVGSLVRVKSALALGQLTVVPHGSVSDDFETAPEVLPEASITAGTLKAIPLGRLLAQVHADLYRRASDAPKNEQWARHVVEVFNASPTETSVRTGRPALSDDLLREVAIAYLTEAEKGPGLTSRVADRFNRPSETIRDWIRASRKRGYLTKADPGRRGAAPGPRLLHDQFADDDPNLATAPGPRPKKEQG